MSKELLDSYVANWPKHTKVDESSEGQENLKAFLSMLADDVVYEDVPTGFSVEGHDGVTQMCNIVSGQYDVTIEVTSAQSDGEHFALEYQTLMRIKETGKELTGRGAAVGSFSDGKVSSHRDYYDRSAMAAAE